jgi:serine palmitoyltransferase
MLLGNVAYSLAAGGGFCAGSSHVVEHQRINGSSFVYSASMPGLLATAASEGIAILRNTPSLLSTLQENTRAMRTVLEKSEHVTIPSHSASPLIHLHIAPAFAPASTGLTSPMTARSPRSPRPPPISAVTPSRPSGWDIATEERLLQEVVEECLAQGVLVTRAKRLRGQELVEARPSVRIAVTAALSRKDCEKAATVIRAAAAKVLGRRR